MLRIRHAFVLLLFLDFDGHTKGESMKRIAILAALVALSVSSAAHAAWPERPITFIVPYAAGGLNDNSARITAQWLAKVLKQGVVVENKTGANGAIAAEYVARAHPDGYTFLMTAAPTMVMVPHTQKTNYDTFKSFAPISIMDDSYIAFAVNPAHLPAKTFADLVAAAKAQPNKISYATGGVGASGHLSMSLLLKQVGMSMTHVPYKGSSAAVVAVLGGHVPVYVGTLSDVIEHHKSGKLRILGLSSSNRLPQHPDLPTIAEQGYPGYKVVTWNGLLAPAGTPKEIVATVSDALRAACQDPGVTGSYRQLGVDPICLTPEQFSERMRNEFGMWAEAVKASGANKQ